MIITPLHQNRLNCTIHMVPVEQLKPYYQPEMVFGFCSQCQRYGLNWSCPPHDFDTAAYWSRFSRAYVADVKVSLTSCSDSEAALACYYEHQRTVNQRLLSHEATLENSVIFIAGHCELCPVCTRQSGAACTFPTQQRYSLESLGFNVAGIINHIFGDTLQWQQDHIPAYMHIVAGVFTNSAINKPLNDIFIHEQHEKSTNN